jgi:hypothetical protein
MHFLQHRASLRYEIAIIRRHLTTGRQAIDGLRKDLCHPALASASERPRCCAISPIADRRLSGRINYRRGRYATV